MAEIDTEEFEEKEWFTNSTDYEYFYNFWEGLGLISEFDTADKCMYAIIYFIDDITHFRNNVTEEFFFTPANERVYIYPFISFTQVWGTNFSSIFPECYDLIFVEVFDYFSSLYSQMESDFNTLLLSFLFSQMANANRFKSALDQIDEYTQNQQYELVMNVYG